VSEVRVRAATADDLSALRALAAAVAEAPHWTDAQWAASIGDGDGDKVVLLAEEHGRVVGFLAASLVHDVVSFDSIVVAERARRQGIGRLLLAALRRYAAERGGALIELEVRESNARARGFYAALGFREVGRRRRYYSDPQEDAILLTATL